MTKHQSNRRGYALMLVMIFVVLFTAMLGVAWRRVASALRIEHVSEVRNQCDKGSIQILAQAIKLLETRLLWDNGNSVVKLDGSTNAELSYSKITGDKYYKITFNRTTSGDSNPTEWSVSVVVLTPEEFASLSLPNLPDPP
jgi:hypothetical protein